MALAGGRSYTSGTCRSIAALERQPSLKVAGFSIWPYDSPTVIVFRYDGSTQCLGGGISLEDMAKVLTDAGIKVVNPKKGHDGLVRTGNCGNHTGIYNAYEIASSDLDKALKLGFAYLSTPDLEIPMQSLEIMTGPGVGKRKFNVGPWPFPW